MTCWCSLARGHERPGAIAAWIAGEDDMKAEKAENANCFGPIEHGCTCWTCTHFSLAYLHHLFKAKEVTASILATVHNLHFMIERMKKFRDDIACDRL